MTYPVTALTTPSRYPERATYEKPVAHALLDEAYVCHIGFVVDGAPRVLPTLYVRDGDRVYLHGSTAATPWLMARRAGQAAAEAAQLHGSTAATPWLMARRAGQAAAEAAQLHGSTAATPWLMARR